MKVYGIYRRSHTDKVIAVEKIKIAGKRPSLFIVQGNELTKVASFSSENSAKRFCDILDEFLGLQGGG